MLFINTSSVRYNYWFSESVFINSFLDFLNDFNNSMRSQILRLIKSGEITVNCTERLNSSNILWKLQNIRKVLLIAFSAAIIAVVTYYCTPNENYQRAAKWIKYWLKNYSEEIMLYSNAKLIRTSLGFRPHGKKRFEKDN